MVEQKPAKNEKWHQCPVQGREQLGLHNMRVTSARVVLMEWGLGEVALIDGDTLEMEG